MKGFPYFGRKLEHLCCCSYNKTCCFYRSFQSLIMAVNQFLVFHFSSSFYVQLGYFITISLFGYVALKISKPRSDHYDHRPHDLDLFFTSVSSTTVSSMATLEMELFSNTQLIIITLLMFLGGEVFTSLLGLVFDRSKLINYHHHHVNIRNNNNNINNSITLLPPSNTTHCSNSSNNLNCNQVHDVERGLVLSTHNFHEPTETHHEQGTSVHDQAQNFVNNLKIKYNSSVYLGYTVLGYLVGVHTVGIISVYLYMSVIGSARKILKDKGIQVLTFSAFTVVSTFANCGFVPTNENMIIFKKNSGLLLLLVPLTLVGNTLYPPCLRLLIWVSDKLLTKENSSSSKHVLRNFGDMGYGHLLSSRHSFLLFGTVMGFWMVQFVMVCSLEWKSENMEGMNGFEKMVACLFQSVNSRHSGESVFDLSILSTAVLAIFIVMMYLPPYTTFLPTNTKDEQNNSTVSCRDDKEIRPKQRNFMENVMLSQLSYLVISVVLICIAEREKLKQDPLNFNLLTITTEVISAYGSVGFTTGYSCKRKLKGDELCKDTWAGFVGRWSNQGKFIVILIMFFGRLKKFSMGGGKSWHLS